MTSTDESVLLFIGLDGRSPGAVAVRFPGFDVTRLVRAHLVEVVSPEAFETQAHVHGDEALPIEGTYVLTTRGAEAVGLLP